MMKRPHPNARTTLEVRDAIRESPESLKALARKYGINPKTVAKWKKRTSGDDRPAGPRSPHPRKLTAEQEEIIVRFREHTLLPLDDCLYALQARIPHLSRSSLHRCLQRHGISRLPEASGEGAEERVPHNTLPVGTLQLDLVAVYSAEGTHHLFIAIDQASKYAFVQLARSAGATDAVAFLDELAKQAPFHIRRVDTMDAEPFVAGGRSTTFGHRCRERGIEHRISIGPHPRMRSQRAQMEKVIKTNVTYESEAYISGLLRDFVRTYNYRRRLKTLRGQTPHAFICETWRLEPERFLRNPNEDTPQFDQ